MLASHALAAQANTLRVFFLIIAWDISRNISRRHWNTPSPFDVVAQLVNQIIDSRHCESLTLGVELNTLMLKGSRWN
jgi:hypothetical protein